MKPYYERYWKGKNECLDFVHKWPKLRGFMPKGKNKFLEFGCGKGTLLSPIAKLNPQLDIYGVDVSKTAISFIKKRIPRGKFNIIEDNKRLPFKSESFDFILCSDVMEHVYDTELIFSEIVRVLKRSGHIFISVPYHGQFKNLLFTLIAFDAYFNPRQPHIRFYTKGNLIKEIETSGLKVVKFGYYGRVYPISHGMYAYCSKPA